MECDVCLLEWDSSKRIPRLLSCGHTFCQECLVSIAKKVSLQNRSFTCPTCQNEEQSIQSEDDITNLVKNFNLLRIAEKVCTRKISQAQNPNNASMLLIEDNDNNINSINSSSNNNSNIFTFPLNKDVIPPLQSGFIIPKSSKSISQSSSSSSFTFDIDKKCPKHGLPIHSYAIGTNLLFCDTCISETNLTTTPLPNVIHELKRKLDQSAVKACLTKNEIEKIEIFFDKYITEFKRANTAKIEQTFNYLYSLIKFFHNDANQLLYQCVQEQKSQIKTRLAQLKELNDEVTSIERQLVTINTSSTEKELFNSISTIKKIQHKLTNFINYNLQFDLFSFNIGLNKDKKEQLINAIQDVYHLEVDFFEIQNEPPSIKKILSKGKYWQCICGQLSNSFEDVKCFSCGLYRRVETFENGFANENDEVMYNKRRKEEAEEFQALIKQNSQSEKYYVIDIEWFLMWKVYVMNDMSEKYLPNSKVKIHTANKNIGVLPPPPINNSILLNRNDKGEYELKRNLHKKKDYIIVNDVTWDFFFLNYNGGPAITVSSNTASTNIYTSLLDIGEHSYQTYTSIKELFEDDPFDKKQSSSEIEYSYRSKPSN